MNIKKVSLYGTSGHAKVVIDCILSQQQYEVDFLVDDNISIKTFLDYSVLHSSELRKAIKTNFLISIGNNQIRAKIVQNLQNNFNFSDFIRHKTAYISSSVSIGKGSVVMPKAVINSASKIGAHVIINTASVIEHDCIIEDFCHISPNATLAGGVLVGTGTHIGIGAQILPEIKIGKWATIGAGAVIIKDVPDGATVVGNPGKFIKR